MATRTLVALLLLAVSLAGAEAVYIPDQHLGNRSPRHQDRVVRGLPGLAGPMLARHYGGYVTVDDIHKRRLYYYFATSQGSPQRDPVVLWLNGGPGCSSFDGFVYENGPFDFSLVGPVDGKLSSKLLLMPREFSWNKAANVIYLDSPAGVGMSYSRTHEDYKTNDTHTAYDTNSFLRRFFEEYPEFADNDFFIAGESYAGVYVPMLAKKVLEGNDAGDQPKIRIQGYSVGNGVTDMEFDGNALIPFAHQQSLIDNDLYEDVQRECKGHFWNATKGSDCANLIRRVHDMLSGINLYDILEPCYQRPEDEDKQQRWAQLQAAVVRDGSRGMYPLGGLLAPGPVPSWPTLLGPLAHTPPCIDSREMWAFLNDDANRAAIHAEPINSIGRFDECSDRIKYTHDAGSMLRYHASNIERGLRVLVYSGDHDMCVPHTGTEAWTRALGLPKRRPWRQWLVDGQVAGFVVEYEGLTYATVMGAGHMTPQTKPKQSFHMFSSFLAGKHL